MIERLSHFHWNNTLQNNLISKTCLALENQSFTNHTKKCFVVAISPSTFTTRRASTLTTLITSSSDSQHVPLYIEITTEKKTVESLCHGYPDFSFIHPDKIPHTKNAQIEYRAVVVMHRSFFKTNINETKASNQ